jgi:hypothetical protein
MIAATFENHIITECEIKFIIKPNLNTPISNCVSQTTIAKTAARKINSVDSGFAIEPRDVSTRKLTIATGQVASWYELHQRDAIEAHKKEA